MQAPRPERTHVFLNALKDLPPPITRKQREQQPAKNKARKSTSLKLHSHSTDEGSKIKSHKIVRPRESATGHLVVL